MAVQLWDPYRTFNIFVNKDEQIVFCVGREVSSWNSRCNHRIPRQKVSEIHALLEKIALSPPEDASTALRGLAQLSLCEDGHQDQKIEVAARWKKLLAELSEEKGVEQQLRSENQRLLESLAEERRERVRLQALLTEHDDSDSAKSVISEQSDDSVEGYKEDISMAISNIRANIKAKLNGALRDAARHEKNFQAAEAARKRLADRLEYSETMYAKRDREAQSLKELMTDQKVDFTIQIEQERQAALEAKRTLQESKAGYDASRTKQAMQIAELQFDLQEKDRLLDMRLVEVKEKTDLCSLLASRIEQLDLDLHTEQEASESLRGDIQTSTQTELNLAQTVATLEASLETSEKKYEELQNMVTDAQNAEVAANQKLEEFRSKFLEKEESLQAELDQAVKRRTELMEEVDSLQAKNRQTIIKSDEALASILKEQEDLANERDSLQSQLSSERHSSFRFTKDLEEAKEAQHVLVEEINLLRSQLDTERQTASEIRKSLEDTSAKLKIQVYKFRGEAQEQKELARQHEETAQKLDQLLTASKEHEAYLIVQLTSTQSCLRHAQTGQRQNSPELPEIHLEAKPAHVKALTKLKQLATQSPTDIIGELKGLSRRAGGWLASCWSRPREPPANPESGLS